MCVCVSLWIYWIHQIQERFFFSNIRVAVQLQFCHHIIFKKSLRLPSNYFSKTRLVCTKRRRRRPGRSEAWNNFAAEISSIWSLRAPFWERTCEEVSYADRKSLPPADTPSIQWSKDSESHRIYQCARRFSVYKVKALLHSLLRVRPDHSRLYIPCSRSLLLFSYYLRSPSSLSRYPILFSSLILQFFLLCYSLPFSISSYPLSLSIFSLTFPFLSSSFPFQFDIY